MDSKGTAKFTNSVKGSLTLVFDGNATSVKFDGADKSIPSDHVLVIKDIAPDTHTLAKGSGEAHLFYMLFTPDSSESSSEATTSTTKETSTTTTTKAPVEPDPESTTKAPVSAGTGDVDSSGTIDMTDVKQVLDHMVGLIELTIDKADVNKDGVINGKDAYYIANKLIN